MRDREMEERESVNTYSDTYVASCLFSIDFRDGEVV